MEVPAETPLEVEHLGSWRPPFGPCSRLQQMTGLACHSCLGALTAHQTQPAKPRSSRKALFGVQALPSASCVSLGSVASAGGVRHIALCGMILRLLQCLIVAMCACVMHATRRRQCMEHVSALLTAMCMIACQRNEWTEHGAPSHRTPARHTKHENNALLRHVSHVTSVASGSTAAQ